MPDEEGVKPRAKPSAAKSGGAHQPGRMEPTPAPRVPVASVGRHQGRAYCGACGAKRKDGACPRGHPN